MTFLRKKKKAYREWCRKVSLQFWQKWKHVRHLNQIILKRQIIIRYKEIQVFKTAVREGILGNLGLTSEIFFFHQQICLYYRWVRLNKYPCASSGLACLSWRCYFNSQCNHWVTVKWLIFFGNIQLTIFLKGMIMKI